jgi:hypothetical protein
VAAIKRAIAITVMGMAGSAGNCAKTSDDVIAPTRPIAACMPNAVDRTMVGKSSTMRTSRAFHAETDTAANTHENATTCECEQSSVG